MKIFPQRRKITLVSSFGNNIYYAAKELAKDDGEQIVILKTKNCHYNFDDLKDESVQIIEFKLSNFIQSIFHLATSKVIFIDNYFGFLSATNFKENVTCVQLWHAAGAIKQFGLMDPSIKNRSKRALKRFLKVYQRFHYVVVGSEKMASIFRQSFGLSNKNILRTGIPRTDFFFQKNSHSQIIDSLKEKYPVMRKKKVILYAPTFRDGQLNSFDLALNIEKMYKELNDDYVLFLKLHPAIKSGITNHYPDFVVDVSDYHNISYFLLITDCLITDYSSIPFEYSLLNKPMIFFAYDLEEYTASRGFWEDFEQNIPGPLAMTTEDVIKSIKEHNFDLGKIQNYAMEWNQYSRGHSSENLIKAIYKN